MKRSPDTKILWFEFVSGRPGHFECEPHPVPRPTGATPIDSLASVVADARCCSAPRSFAVTPVRTIDHIPTRKVLHMSAVETRQPQAPLTRATTLLAALQAFDSLSRPVTRPDLEVFLRRYVPSPELHEDFRGPRLQRSLVETLAHLLQIGSVKNTRSGLTFTEKGRRDAMEAPEPLRRSYAALAQRFLGQ